MFETTFKKITRLNEPTIIHHEKYKQRFKKAIKKYFVAMCIQNEKLPIEVQKQQRQEKKRLHHNQNKSGVSESFHIEEGANLLDLNNQTNDSIVIQLTEKSDQKETKMMGLIDSSLNEIPEQKDDSSIFHNT